MTQDEIIEIDEARTIAVTFGIRMCDEHGDAHGEELYCVGIDDIRDIIKLVAAKEREACATIAIDGCLVPPDGGSPTEDERLLCEHIAHSIRERT